MSPLAPIAREVRVPAPPEVAFDVFTERIGTWWPLASFSVHGAAASVAFVDGAIVESAPGAEDSEWGRVLRWERPATLAFTWHPGAGAERVSEVTVTFAPDGDGTLVRLVHSGWEHYAEPARSRDEYGRGWPMVLEAYGNVIPAA